jgi:hypothetical protein
MTTSENELRQLAAQRRLKPFSVFAIDEIPTKIKPGYYIINSAPRISGGRHWVAAHYDTRAKYAHLFDSFGIPPDERLVRWLKSGGKQILTNTGHLQDIKRSTCGQWCIEFLENMSKGGSLIDFITDFNAGFNHEKNEQILEHKLND